ncbi:gamma-glutamyltransferase [bacterium]|jgi:gamma-glutamyltranspeptidase / glutathione hydrolase|nr:gamma-glutamyltransferase [bacterium]MBT5015534.1 gamma-glutamyltransferase [bacterium]
MKRIFVLAFIILFSLDGRIRKLAPKVGRNVIAACKQVKRAPKPLEYNPTNFNKSRNRPVVGKVGRGMVVCDDVAAGRWGTSILRLGGNAIDAAVAIAFMLAVTRPHYASIGGGGFALYCPAGRSDGFAFDFRETAPSCILKDEGNCVGNKSVNMLFGARSCGVPGTVHGLLSMHNKFGKIHRRKLLQRPIKVAWDGTQMTGNMYFSAQAQWETMNQEARDILGVNNKIKEPGELVKQPDLAKTLKRISQYGIDGFYKGPVARKLVEGIKNSNGILTREDLLNYQVKEREPLYGRCQEYKVLTMPPSSAGGVALLQLFHFMEGAFKEHQEACFNIGDSCAWHIMAQALALAFADRSCYVADPEFVKVPLKDLLSCEYLMNRWMKFFNKDKFELPKLPKKTYKEGTDTTHISIIDADGNAVSMTLTVHSKFGSGFVPKGTGVFMNNECDDFSVNSNYRNRFELKTGELNKIEPLKRPLSSMTPTVIKKSNGENCIVIGAAGGPQIISAIWQSLVNRFYFQMCLADAVVHPRIHHQYDPNQIYYERGALSKEVQEMLMKKGHVLQEDTHLGTVQALEKMDDGFIWGISDPRSEGIAVAA